MNEADNFTPYTQNDETGTTTDTKIIIIEFFKPL